MIAWRDLAACDGRTDPPMDLPNVELGERRKVARWYCLDCPVKRECARDALAGGDVGVIRAGVWCSPYSGGAQSRVTRRDLRSVAGE